MDTATAPSDYTAIASTLLTFNPGHTSKTVSVTINGDIGFEPDETFFVNLSNPVNATISDNQGTGHDPERRRPGRIHQLQSDELQRQ